MGLTLLTDSVHTRHDDQDFKKKHGAFLYKFPLTKGKATNWKLQSVKMRMVHDLLSSKDKESDELLTSDCSFGIQLARRETFYPKKHGKDKKKKDEFNEAFKSTKIIIRTMSICNNGTSKLYPMVKQRIAGHDPDKIYLIKNKTYTRKFDFDDSTKGPSANEKDDTQQTIIEAFYTTDSSFQAKKGYYFRISHN